MIIHKYIILSIPRDTRFRYWQSLRPLLQDLQGHRALVVTFSEVSNDTWVDYLDGHLLVFNKGAKGVMKLDYGSFTSLIGDEGIPLVSKTFYTLS